MRINNLKQLCAICKKQAAPFKMVLMVGPKGYRTYKLCEKCASKTQASKEQQSAKRTA